MLRIAQGRYNCTSVRRNRGQIVVVQPGQKINPCINFPSANIKSVNAIQDTVVKSRQWFHVPALDL